MTIFVVMQYFTGCTVPSLQNKSIFVNPDFANMNKS